ncbi:UNVERIFIED_CONTAM: putative RNA methyltransferase [Sesamum indicum]
MGYGSYPLHQLQKPLHSFTRLISSISFHHFFSFFSVLHLPFSIFVLQRALPIRILTVGKKRSPGVQLILDEYIEKLKHYCPVEDVRLKSNPKNARDVMAQIEHEDIAVMGLIKSNEWGLDYPQRPEVSSLDVTPSLVNGERPRDDSIHGCMLNMQPFPKAVKIIVVC